MDLKNTAPEIDINPVRQLAAKLLENLPFRNEAYYALEDYFVDILNNKQVEFPKINFYSFCLEHVLRTEIVEYITNDWSSEEVDEDLIQDIIESLTDRFDNNCLNLNLIRSECNRKITERRYEKCKQTLF